MTPSLTPDFILLLVAVALAIVFEHVAALRGYWELLAPERKRLIMLALLVAATLATLVAQCQAEGACYAARWQEALTAFAMAVAVNQSIHRLVKR